MCLQKAGKSEPLWVHKSRCLATTSRAGVDRMIRNAVMKTVNLWASKKVLRLHLTIKTSPCAITRLSSCPLWNFFNFFLILQKQEEAFAAPGVFQMLQKSQLAKKLSTLSICSISKYESFPPKHFFLISPFMFSLPRCC